MLTEEQKKKYVRDGGCRCPYCGSGDINGRGFRYEEQTILQSVRCGNCGKSWQDVYKLAEILEY